MLVLSHRSANDANKPTDPMTRNDKCPNKLENVSRTGLWKHLSGSPLTPVRHPIFHSTITKSRKEGRTTWWGSLGGLKLIRPPQNVIQAFPLDNQTLRCFSKKPSSSQLSGIYHYPVTLWGKVIGDLAVEDTPLPPPRWESKKDGVRKVHTVCAVWVAAYPR